jgi:prepilin-type N-terminal cleavage/methylation domain-containing protein/prepilin-type processing-associated H-X9-DG protein
MSLISKKYGSINCDSCSTDTRRGFTLIELLVVIAIIALLAAILFPVFARARENARKSACMSNMKQIGLGAAQYSQDYDEYTIPTRLCVGGSTSNATMQYFAWSDIIQPYLKSTQVLVCPSSKGKAQSIAYNNKVGSSFLEPVTSNPFPNRKLSTFDIPAQTVAFIDAAGTASLEDSSGNAQSPLFGVATNSAGGDVLGRLARAGTGHSDSWAGWPRADVHLEGCNYLFADGHVKWLTSVADAVKNSANTVSSIAPEITRVGASNYIGPHREGVSYGGIAVGTATLYN